MSLPIIRGKNEKDFPGPVGGFPLDSLAKKWIRLITYAGFPREKVRSSIRIRVFLHTNNCLPPYVMSVSLLQ